MPRDPRRPAVCYTRKSLAKRVVAAIRLEPVVECDMLEGQFSRAATVGRGNHGAEAHCADGRYHLVEDRPLVLIQVYGRVWLSETSFRYVETEESRKRLQRHRDTDVGPRSESISVTSCKRAPRARDHEEFGLDASPSDASLLVAHSLVQNGLRFVE